MTDFDDIPFETKVADANVRALHDEQQRTFAAFREANDDRLDAVARRKSADVLLEEKVERISATLDDLVLKSRRPALETRASHAASAPSEHKSAFDAYVRKGDASAMHWLEQKALSVTIGQDGGFTVPLETEAAIGRLLQLASPMRQVASVRQISASVYRKPFTTQGAGAGWVAERTARPETTSQIIAELQFPAAELYAMPSTTQTLLDDSIVDIDQWLAEEVQLAFATQESQAFVNGDGVNRPRGFLASPTVADASWAWGSLGFIVTGAAAGLPATNPSDVLVNLVYSLKSAYRQNAVWMMNRRTQGELRRLKDSTGAYLWQPGAVASASPTLMGFPVVEEETMPVIAANAFPVAFGDFRQGYLIVDRVGVRVLRDPFSAKPYVLFYTTKRVGGGVQNFEAIKLLRVSV